MIHNEMYMKSNFIEEITLNLTLDVAIRGLHVFK